MAARSNMPENGSVDRRRAVASQHPPAIEAYLRETDRYKAFLVGHRPDAPSPHKNQGLARKVDSWESKWASAAPAGRESRGTLLNRLLSYTSLRPCKLTHSSKDKALKNMCRPGA